MAEATRKEEVKILLELSEDEAEYLQGITQNPACDNDIVEDALNKQCRESIWTVLRRELEVR